MSDKNRKDGEFSLPDMREMFEHYTSVEDDEPAAQRSEMEDLARRYLDCGDDETGVESRQESGAVTEEKEPGIRAGVRARAHNRVRAGETRRAEKG